MHPTRQDGTDHVACRWCVQQRGIPQGSITSSLLCDLFLSHLQSTVLAPVLLASHPGPPPARPQQPLNHCGPPLPPPPIGDRGPSRCRVLSREPHHAHTPHCPPHRVWAAGSCAVPAQHAVAGTASVAISRCPECGRFAAAQRSTQHGESAATRSPPLQPLLVHMADDFLLLTPVAEVVERVVAACRDDLPRHGVNVGSGAAPARLRTAPPPIRTCAPQRV